MATRKLNFLEKVANNLGVLYRYQAAQFPRRWDILKKVAVRELAPPTPKDVPAIKADWVKLNKFIDSGAYKDLSVRVGSITLSGGADGLYPYYNCRSLSSTLACSSKSSAGSSSERLSGDETSRATSYLPPTSTNHRRRRPRVWRRRWMTRHS